ncbi:hypothetical protein E8E13_002868 [Curvularia kusanoi]|uniref:tyrosinase n=1 Tax=Curvularia kusanoi TaxID=90978 RepID=A0A9P4WAB7_CURKU|nr:hypothetical protein E8E13_002868 [Curvularia kusanoi]
MSKPKHTRDGIVRGIDGRDQDGSLFLRLDVRNMKSNYPDQWNLFMLGLDQLQTSDQGDPYSYYGIASIHGRPYRTHLDAPGIAGKIGTTGYCPHILHSRIQTIAEHAPSNQIDRWRWAAHSFRIPYWDWSQGDRSGEVPDFFMTETIMVETPEGRRMQMWNPLYKFDFKPVPAQGFDGKASSWPASDNDWEDSRQSEFALSFRNMRRQIQDQVALAFRQTTLNGFWKAIEEVHGWVHGAIGGGYSAEQGGKGHMWPLEYSSYEPLFWLHHANVDRLFALYQTQNPTLTLQRSNVGTAGNVFVADHTEVDGNTPLLPFRISPGVFWTTNEAMNWRRFGYDYAETRNTDPAAARATVAQLFSGTARERLASGQMNGVFATQDSLLDDADDSAAAYTDWNIKAAAAPEFLPASFSVQFSLVGDFSSDKATNVGMWAVLMPGGHGEDELVGSAGEEKIMGGVSAAERTRSGTVSLTSSLLDQVESGALESLDERDVVPFLKDKLSWKVYSGDGVQLPNTFMDAFRIEVTSQTARVPSDPDEAIEYRNGTVSHIEVTAGKKGGVD